MSFADIAVLALVGLAVCAAVVWIVRRRKMGRSGCGGCASRAGCSSRAACDKCGGCGKNAGRDIYKRDNN